MATAILSLCVILSVVTTCACSHNNTVTVTTTRIITTEAPLIETCVDNNSNCKGYIDLNHDFCQKYSVARTYCAKSCHFCTTIIPPTTATPSICENKWSNCTDYDPRSCLQNQTFFSEGCAQFCGFCDLTLMTSGFDQKCMYNGKVYKQGEKWYDGCDYECICKDGATGTYKCSNRCPVYYNVPSQCTFIRKEGYCCLQPICNFNGSLQITTNISKGRDGSDNEHCLYNGQLYVQGSMTQNDCNYKCQCTNASQGIVTCHDTCPVYDVKSLPSSCSMHRDPGTCCNHPKCNFDSTVGVFTGSGSTSGKGMSRKLYDPDLIKTCKDLDLKCMVYTKSACKGTLESFMTENCPVLCGACEKKFGRPQPGPMEKCFHQGVPYKTGDVWQPDCEHSCVCDQELYGFYRCSRKCPQYPKVPTECTVTKTAVGACCPEMVLCPWDAYIIPTTTNISSVGGGDNIYRGDSPENKTAVTTGTLDQRNSIAGCLYNGYVLVQGEIDPGTSCSPVCRCVDEDKGKLVCHERCVEFVTDKSCKMVKDPQDPCCSIPDCPDAVKNKTTTIYPTPKVTYSPVKKHSVTTTTGSPFTSPLTTSPTPTRLPKSANPPPTLPPGYIFGKNDSACYFNLTQTSYQPGERWQQGCDYNCLCLGGINGKYTCAEMCKRFICPAGMHCTSYKDKDFPCCSLLKVELTTVQPTDTTYTTVEPSTTRIGGQCWDKFSNRSRSVGDTWRVGCDYQCWCEVDQQQRYYATKCKSVCPSWKLPPKCTIAKPRPGKCCGIPSCPGIIFTIPDKYKDLF